MDIIVQVDLKDLDLTEEIAAYYDEDGERCGGRTIAEAVVASLATQASKGDYYSGLKQRVQEIRDEEIRAAIAPVIADALTTPITSTNRYGEPTGKSTTLRELIAEDAKRYMQEMPDNYGRPGGGTRIQQAIRAQVEAVFKQEISDAVKAAREAVTQQLGKSVSDVVTEAVRNGLRAS